MSEKVRKITDRHMRRLLRDLYNDCEAVMYYSKTGNQEEEDFHRLSYMVTAGNLKSYILQSLSDENIQKRLEKVDFEKLEKKMKAWKIREENKKDIDIKKLIIKKILRDKKKLSE